MIAMLVAAEVNISDPAAMALQPSAVAVVLIAKQHERHCGICVATTFIGIVQNVCS